MNVKIFFNSLTKISGPEVTEHDDYWLKLKFLKQGDLSTALKVVIVMPFELIVTSQILNVLYWLKSFKRYALLVCTGCICRKYDEEFTIGLISFQAILPLARDLKLLMILCTASFFT